MSQRKAYECLCSPLGLWAGSLRREGGQASVASNYPALPAGTRSVDVILPGVATLSGIPVVAAEDLAARLGAPQSYAADTWIYYSDDPPRGWSTDQWPTPLPDPDQLRTIGSPSRTSHRCPAGEHSSDCERRQIARPCLDERASGQTGKQV